MAKPKLKIRFGTNAGVVMAEQFFKKQRKNKAKMQQVYENQQKAFDRTAFRTEADLNEKWNRNLKKIINNPEKAYKFLDKYYNKGIEDFPEKFSDSLVSKYDMYSELTTNAEAYADYKKNNFLRKYSQLEDIQKNIYAKTERLITEDEKWNGYITKEMYRQAKKDFINKKVLSQFEDGEPYGASQTKLVIEASEYFDKHFVKYGVPPKRYKPNAAAVMISAMMNPRQHLFAEEETSGAQTLYVGQRVKNSTMVMRDKNGNWTKAKSERENIRIYKFWDKSKKYVSLDNFVAVQTSDRRNGWVKDGVFIPENDLRFNLYAVSQTMYGLNGEIDLLAIYDSMTGEQRAKFQLAMTDFVSELSSKDGLVGWDAFYEEYVGSPNDKYGQTENLRSGEKGILRILEIMNAVMS